MTWFIAIFVAGIVALVAWRSRHLWGELRQEGREAWREARAELEQKKFAAANPAGPPLTDDEIAAHVAWFEGLARDALILRPDPAAPALDAAARLGGPAWLAADEAWPADPEGRRLEFVAQLDFARLPPLEGFPRRGIARFFVGTDDLFGADFDRPDRSAARVLWHDGAAAGGRLEPPAPLGPDDLTPFQSDAVREQGLALVAAPIRDLPDSYGWEAEARLAGSFRREGVDEVSDRLFALSETREYGHRIGGHPVFTQSDFRRPGEHDDFDTVLLGLSSDDAIMWGDAGEAVFMVRGADLAKGDLSRVAFYWDCH